jgi:uncharacterized cupredoxin-like copper-binding protein
MIHAVPLLLVLVLVACAPGEDGERSPATGEEAITVTLTEHEIVVDGSVSAGEVTFVLRNEGDQTHGFVVTGNGLDDTLTTDVRPGETERVTARLEAGTYTLWCPIGDHRDLGMEAELQVSEAEGS